MKKFLFVILLMAIPTAFPVRGGESLLAPGIDLTWDEETEPEPEEEKTVAAPDSVPPGEPLDPATMGQPLGHVERLSIARLAETAELQVNRHEYEDALSTIEKAMEIDPTYIPLWLQSARANMALGRNENAAAALAICLKRNPYDTQANYLVMMNILQWEGMPDAEKAARLGEAIRTMDAKTFDRAAAMTVERDELPAMLGVLIEGWRRGGDRSTAAIPVLRMYEANRLEDARKIIDASSGLSPSLARALKSLVARAEARGGLETWIVERGDLSWNGRELVLEAPPATQAFAWLRLSKGWRDVTLMLDAGGGDPTPREVYLRYDSPASYLRLLFEGERVLVQERLPRSGLVGIYEAALPPVSGSVLTVVLKDGRIGLFVDGKLASQEYIAVSPPVTRGAVVLALDNRNGDGARRAHFGIRAAKLPERWTALRADEDFAELPGLLESGEITGMLVPTDGSVPEGVLARAMMIIANSGVKILAVPPAGEKPFESLSGSLPGLPKSLTKSLWSGVLLPAEDLTADVAARAAEEGLPLALSLDGGRAGELKRENFPDNVSWILFRDDGTAAEPVLTGLADFDGTVLYGRRGEREIFSEIPSTE